MTHVVNFELPNVPEGYVHRIGRTARAGAEGIAISLCSGEERAFLRDIERTTRQTIPASDRMGDATLVSVATPAGGGERGHRHQPAGHRSGAPSNGGHKYGPRTGGRPAHAAGNGHGPAAGVPSAAPMRAAARAASGVSVPAAPPRPADFILLSSRHLLPGSSLQRATEFADGWIPGTSPGMTLWGEARAPSHLSVIPAQAGTPEHGAGRRWSCYFETRLDPRLRGDDGGNAGGGQLS
ncbi:MAG: hypothetical protein WDN31_21610 [Hyphomicrobium sp.]